MVGGIPWNERGDVFHTNGRITPPTMQYDSISWYNAGTQSSEAKRELMTIYVDETTDYPDSMISRSARRNGTKWCHMFADTEEELKDFATRLGLKKQWFQKKHNPFLSHYDIVPSKRALAIKLGAIEESTKEYIVRTRIGLK